LFCEGEVLDAKTRRKYNHEWYLKHREEERKKRHVWYIAHREESIERARQWRLKNPSVVLICHRNWLKKVKGTPAELLKQKARSLARKIKATGRCAVCGSATNLQRHHPDYSSPLKVIILCDKCHRKIHRKR
jgi:hypothetical protein